MRVFVFHRNGTKSVREQIGKKKKEKKENLAGIAKNDFGRNFIVPSRNDGQMKFRR